MKIEPIIMQDGLPAHVSGYFCSRSSFDEGCFCDLLQQLTHRDNIQFALVQGVESKISAVVAQISEQNVQGTLVHTKIPYGKWMVGLSITCEPEKAKMIAQLQSDCRWPDETGGFGFSTLRKCNDLITRWNELTQIEAQITAALPSSTAREDAVRLLWKAAGITHEYSVTFKEEMCYYVAYQGYEHQDLVPYMMRSKNWRLEQWYPSPRLL